MTSSSILKASWVVFAPGERTRWLASAAACPSLDARRAGWARIVPRTSDATSRMTRLFDEKIKEDGQGAKRSSRRVVAARSHDPQPTLQKLTYPLSSAPNPPTSFEQAFLLDLLAAGIDEAGRKKRASVSVSPLSSPRQKKPLQHTDSQAAASSSV